MVPSVKIRQANLDREGFEMLNNLPNESTLEVNITHKKLVEFEGQGWETVALSPTRYEEGNITNGGGPLGKGFDITFDTAREIVFQHKAPKKTVVRGEDNRNKRLWLQYDIDFSQLLNLAVQYNPRQAYLALPAVPQQGLLDKSLFMTVFVDVWTLYSHVLEDGLLPDYILVEYLPDWLNGMRPDFNRNGKLKRDEYYRENPLIKCKYKCKKWSMKVNKPDPYIELSLSNTLFAHAVRWKEIKAAFMRSSAGLGITSNLRTDGGDRLPEGWPPIELPNEYSEEYRGHLKRKYALSRLGKEYKEQESEAFIQWLVDNLQERYKRAIEMEILKPLSYDIDEEMLLENVYQYETSTREILEGFAGKESPETYRIGNASRHLVQYGPERDDPFPIM